MGVAGRLGMCAIQGVPVDGGLGMCFDGVSGRQPVILQVIALC